MWFQANAVPVFIVIISSVVVQSWPVTLSGLTKPQQLAIGQLRDRVQNVLTLPYMKEDLYLLRWLSAKNFNVDQAAKLLTDNLKWRMANNIDNILKGDWSRMDAEFPYSLNIEDKLGRPVLFINLGDWDIRKLAVAGMLPKLTTYFAKMFEEADMKVWKLRSQGKDITQFTMIMNMNGYNIQQHACIQCLPFYSSLTQTLEANYPGTAERVFFVNSPSFFEVVLKLVQGVLSKQSRDTIKVYGTDPKSWEPVLLDFIDRSQLPDELYM